MSANLHTIGIAGMKVVEPPERIRTVLGSCIGIALYDRVAKVAGLAHIMLPSSQGAHGNPGKFADTGVDALVEQVTRAGANRKRLSAKISGGASMFGGQGDNGIGEQNIAAVKKRLAEHSIRLAAEHVGGVKGRKMLIDPGTGDVQVEIIGQEAVMI